MKLLNLFMLIVALVFFQSKSVAQIFRSFPEGLGVEVGGGQNNMYWSGMATLLTPGAQNIDRTHFYLTPNIRINYNIQFAEKYSSLFFVGYNRFGGVSEFDNIYQNNYFFDAVEGGTFLLYNISNFRIGAGLKVNYHTYVQFISISPNMSYRTNRNRFFTKWSDDFGIRAMYLLSHFSISMEAWLGLSDLSDLPKISPEGSIKENHFRFLIGYTL